MTEQTFIRDIDQAKRFATIKAASDYAQNNIPIQRNTVVYAAPYYAPGNSDAPAAWVLKKDIKGRGHFLAA